MSREFMLYDLRVTVVSIEGESVCGMQVGDYFELTESSRLRLAARTALLCLRAGLGAAISGGEAARTGSQRLAGARLAYHLSRPGGAPGAAN